MKRRNLLEALAAVAGCTTLPLLAAPSLPPVKVFKNPSCGCCGAWVEHMTSAGFVVEVNSVEDTTVARKRLGMPDAFGSCHPASVGGYVLEGHVPAAEVKRLLGLKPVAIGLAVPSMPPGSPGMESNGREDPYDVLLIDLAGHSSVFASYPKS